MKRVKSKIKKIVKNAFSTQKNKYVLTNEDMILILGINASLISIISGSFMYLFLKAIYLTSTLVNMHLVFLMWIVFGLLTLLGTLMFQDNKEKSGKFLVVVGIISLIVGTGFVIGALLTIITGILAFHYSRKI